MQGARPPHVREVGVADMDPFLRTLLFIDGTVTRTLEAHSLSPVTVEVIDQANAPASALVADYLQLAEEQEITRRRVRIGAGATTGSTIWAESHIVSERLPPRFLELLDGASDGIGEALEEVRLESWREMLWFGLDAPPDWAGAVPASNAGPTVLKRLYRVITQNRPALLISESFAVGQRSGKYHLSDLG
jgi:chorismate--pyruvate lyase